MSFGRETVLSPFDADLVRRDTALPGLGIVLDPEALVDVLRRSLPGADLGSVRATYVKYKPGTNCLAGYQLTVSGRVVDLYAKAYGVHASRKLQKARENPGTSGALGPGRIPLEDDQIVVSVFPNDAKVRALPTLAAVESRVDMLREILPHH